MPSVRADRLDCGRGAFEFVVEFGSALVAAAGRVKRWIAMQSENQGELLRLLSDDADLLQLELVERSFHPDTASGLDAMGPLLGERGYARVVVLSLAATRFVSSSGLAALLTWHKRFRQAGGRLILHSITVPVMETLRVMRMERVLTVASDLASALEAVRGEAA